MEASSVQENIFFNSLSHIKETTASALAARAVGPGCLVAGWSWAVAAAVGARMAMVWLSHAEEGAMKILHTSDWHVGKVLKGRDRHDEHVAVLASIVATARDTGADVVLIAGDLFETAAPSPKAQGLVMRTLLALREDGRVVVAIGGNHDNQGLDRKSTRLNSSHLGNS